MWVGASDDEQGPQFAATGAWHDEAEEICSDGEQPAAAWAWQPAASGEAAGALRQLNGLLPPSGQPPQQQGGLDACQPRGARAFSRAGPARAAPGGSRTADGFRRPMKTAAAAEADRAAAERAAADAAHLEAALAGQQQTTPAPAAAAVGVLEQAALQPAPAPLPQPRPPASGASFLNRRVLPPSQTRVQELRQQLGRSGPEAGAGVGRPAPVPAAEGSQQASQQAPPVPQGSQARAGGRPAPAAPGGGASAGHAAAGAPASGTAAGAAPAATFHRTAEGLNVVYLNRQQQPEQERQPSGRGGGKAKADSVNSGWGNNFVRIDLKKGRGSTKYGTKYGSKQRKRGGRGGRGGGRWHATRLRQVGDGADFLEGWQGSRMRCFKCGGRGHFAKDCTAEAQAQADAGALASSSDSEGERGEGQGAAAGLAVAAQPSADAVQLRQQAAAGGPRLASAGSLAAAAAAATAAGPPLPDPAEQHAEVLADPSEAALTGVLRSVFGHAAFRGLQLPTVQRLLAGESLLSIMPTGMGKSLCYALPAALLPGLTLVVSPLIALMHDQAAAVPPPLTAAVLWSGQSRADALQVLADVAAGRIKVLFVSPERLGNPHLLEALRQRMPLPLVVVDEAHCVAEWGHSFRPAYFRLGAALAGSIQAQRVLALTATATRSTEVAIRQVLRISEGSVLRDAAVRQNLRLQVLRSTGGSSSQASRERACALFAAGGPLAASRSAIVYCAFKEDANQLARMLGARGVSARAYHAGKDYRERSAIESDFAAGRVRVVVATVAFGMGINLASVSAVVHATMPRSLEEYVQQIGRAGRDGSEAQCVALVDDADFVRLRSLAFSGVLDMDAVRAFLQAVFSPAAEGQRKRRGGKAAAQPAGSRGRKRKAAAPAALAGASDDDAGQPGEAASQQQQQQQQQGGTEGGAASEAPAGPAAAGQQDGACAGAQQCSSASGEASAGQVCEDGTDAGAAAPPAPRRFGVLAVRQLAAELDMREDSMEAVLSYLEADDTPCLRMLPATALSVKVSFYAAAPEALAQQYPVVQAVLEACPNPRNGLFSAAAARLAAIAQQAPGLVLQELRNMAAGNLIGFELSREEGLAYEILHSPADLDALAQQVHDRLALVLGCQVSRLDTSYRAIAAAAQLQGQAQEAALREAVERYFDEASGPGSADDQPPAASSAAYSALQLETQGLPLRRAEPALLQAARAVLRRNREQAGPALSARALARILHGVGGPAFPPDAWGKRMGAFWGSHANVDFAAVLKAAEIVLRDSDT